MEKGARGFYMPSALAFLESDIIIHTIGYDGDLVFYDINKRKMVRYIKIKEIGLKIHRDYLLQLIFSYSNSYL